MAVGTRGIAGRLAATFIHSRLTPLLMGAALLLGVFAVLVLPREEEPQIVVPMVDIFVRMPGASAQEVEQRLTRPLEKLMWEVPGVEYLYSTSSAGQATVIVRFFVGEDETAALVRLNQKIEANLELVPPGATPPLVKARSIDDVPVMAATLFGDGWDDHRLRQLAAQVREGLSEVPNVSEVTVIGGRPRQLDVTIDPRRLAAHGLDPWQVREAIVRTNVRHRSGELVRGSAASLVDTGNWEDDAAGLAGTIVGGPGSPVRLGEVAALRDGPAEATSYVTHYARDGRAYPAVTIAIAKRHQRDRPDPQPGRQARHDARRHHSLRCRDRHHAELR
jgi:multidrug efflux pump subunit AcrB